MTTATRALEGGVKDVMGAIERTANGAQQSLRSMDVDPKSIEPKMRHAVRRFVGDECPCAEPVQAAKDQERLKSAVIAGVVLFIASAITFVVARNIAARRRTDMSRPAPERYPPAPSPD